MRSFFPWFARNRPLVAGVGFTVAETERCRLTQDCQTMFPVKLSSTVAWYGNSYLGYSNPTGEAAWLRSLCFVLSFLAGAGA
jgi:hypothetical protein